MNEYRIYTQIVFNVQMRTLYTQTEIKIKKKLNKNSKLIPPCPVQIILLNMIIMKWKNDKVPNHPLYIYRFPQNKTTTTTVLLSIHSRSVIILYICQIPSFKSIILSYLLYNTLQTTIKIYAQQNIWKCTKEKCHKKKTETFSFTSTHIIRKVSLQFMDNISYIFTKTTNNKIFQP